MLAFAQKASRYLLQADGLAFLENAFSGLVAPVANAPQAAPASLPANPFMTGLLGLSAGLLPSADELSSVPPVLGYYSKPPTASPRQVRGLGFAAGPVVGVSVHSVQSQDARARLHSAFEVVVKRWGFARALEHWGRLQYNRVL